MIKVENLSKSYGRIKAVDDVSFEIDKGQIVGLLGPNGAGKTTLMKILTCYHYQDSGKAFIDGIDVSQEPDQVKNKIGYLPETAPLYTEMCVNEYLDFIAEARGFRKGEKKQRIEQTVVDTGLSEVFYRPIRQLSKGYRQRVGLAQAIIHSPQILILDEPTTGLDPNQIIEIRKLITDIGKSKTVILSTHIMQEVEAVCSNVIIVNRGKIVAEGETASISTKLKGSSTLETVLVDSANRFADEQSLEKQLAAVEEFLKIESIVKNGSEFSVVLDVKDDNSALVMFNTAVSNNLKIKSLSSKHFSLEDVFRQLTN
ncbi:MAG: ATP-binding cassette domain-containing protein [Spirochaetales bacterium]|nr:ATP-binding cassette domain-containing protein [Spirochaetales bacterium]